MSIKRIAALSGLPIFLASGLTILFISGPIEVKALIVDLVITVTLLFLVIVFVTAISGGEL